MKNRTGIFCKASLLFLLLWLITWPIQNIQAMSANRLRNTEITPVTDEQLLSLPQPKRPSLKLALSYPPDPSSDIAWTVGTSGVADIQAAFNNARTVENGQLGTSVPMLVLPSQTEWNGMSDGAKALWLINRERIDRGLAPLDGLESNVNGVAQYYANYLLSHNAWGHNADGFSPWDRLNNNPAIGACHDFLSVAENLAVFVTSGSSIELPIEQSIYMWLYEDCCGSGWGHRHAILWYPYNDNSGLSGREGFLGIGRANGGPYQGPFSEPWPFAEIIVMNVFDPCNSWTYPNISISGNAGVSGVTLSYNDGTPKTVTSNASGNYSISVPYGWSGAVTPSRTGFTFVPAGLTYANLDAIQSNQNYLASWVGGIKVEANQNVVAVGRPHVGSEVASYGGFASGSLTAYVPMLFKGAFGGAYDSALYVQNVHASSTASITIKYYDSNGVLSCTKNDTVAPLSSKGYWVPAATGTCTTGSLPAGWTGGAVITSNQPIVAVGRPHVGGEVMTYDGFASGSLTSYIPMLFKGAFGGSYNAAFYLQNTHDTNTANITIKYYDDSGLLNCTKTDTIAPLASKGYWVPAASCDTGSLPAGWIGGVVVTSDQPIVAVGRPHIGSQVTTYNGFPSGSLNSYVPMLFKGAFGGSYNAAFYLQNTHTSNTASVTIKYYDSNGNLNCTKTDTIAPLASKGYWVPVASCDTGSLPAGWVGGVVVTSDQPLVAVGRPHLGAQVTTYDGFAVGSLNAYVPMLFRDGFGGSYDSALYLQNLHASNTANITIKLYDASGNLACTVTDTLSALASKGYWLPGLLCPP